MQVFKQKLGKLADLEKILAKVFVYSVKSTFKSVKYDNEHYKKLKEFKSLLE